MNRQLEQPKDSGLGYRLLRIANEKFGLDPSALTPQQTKQAKDIALKELILEHAVLTSQEAREVVVPESQIEKAFRQIIERYQGVSDFNDALDENGLTESDLKDALARELLVDAVLTYVSSKVPLVDDTEINLFYYMHPEKFRREERRIARHILVTVNPDFPENTRDNASEKINTIRARVKKDPRRFEEQALKHSECPTSFQGGLLGEVKRNTLFPELDDLLFQMSEGEVSEVTETSLGFHILLCDKIHRPHNVPLQEIKEKLREALTDRKRKKYQRDWLREQTEKHQLRVEPEVEVVNHE